MVRLSSALAALCLIISAAASTTLTEQSDDLTTNLSGTTATATATTTTPEPAGTLTYSGTAAPTQSGVSSSCRKYYLVKDGDTCLSIQSQYMDYTLQQFYRWNPSISDDCKGLKPGYFVCVSDGTMPTGATSTLSRAPTQTANSGISGNLGGSSTLAQGLGLLTLLLQLVAL